VVIIEAAVDKASMNTNCKSGKRDHLEQA